MQLHKTKGRNYGRLVNNKGGVWKTTSAVAAVYPGKFPRGVAPSLYRKAEKGAKQPMRGMWSLGDKYVNPRA